MPGHATRSRARSHAGATPIDLAGGVYSGENFSGWEFDLNTDGIVAPFTLQLVGTNPGASANLHVVLARINRPCSANTTLSCGHSLAGAISPRSRPGGYLSVQRAERRRRVVPPAARFHLGPAQHRHQLSFSPSTPPIPPRTIASPSSTRTLTGRLSFTSLDGGIDGRYDWTATVTGTVTVVVFEYTGYRRRQLLHLRHQTQRRMRRRHARLQLHRGQLADQPPDLRLLHHRGERRRCLPVPRRAVRHLGRLHTLGRNLRFPGQPGRRP